MRLAELLKPMAGWMAAVTGDRYPREVETNVTLWRFEQLRWFLRSCVHRTLIFHPLELQLVLCMDSNASRVAQDGQAWNPPEDKPHSTNTCGRDVCTIINASDLPVDMALGYYPI